MRNEFNNERKSILLAIDNGSVVSNLELGMYDLTPYYKEEFDVSLAEKILYYQKHLNRVEHIRNSKLYFMPEQMRAFDFLKVHTRCIISAPTSFGKTMIVKEYIYKIKPKSVVFIVPTNALAYELEMSFKSNDSFDGYTIYDKRKLPKAEIEDYIMFIGTQEKYLEIKDDFSDNVELFIIDEAYKLEESTKKQRSYKLSQSFIDSIAEKCKQVFLLSPNAEYIGFEDYHFQIFDTEFNAVDKELKQLSQDAFFSCLEKKANEEKCILFCDTPVLINHTIEKLPDFGIKIVTDDELENLIDEVHEDWSVIQLLKKGILVHHGQIPKYIQNFMINKFNTDASCNLLIGTNSISEGINTPTKNLFIHPDYRNINDQKLLIKNTIGRAGRLGEYPIGHIYSCEDLSELVNSKITIQLSISKDDEMQEITETKDDNQIEEFINKHNISKETYLHIISTYKISKSKLESVLDALKTDCKFASFDNLTYIAYSAFSKDYYFNAAQTDNFCIKGYFRNYYKDDLGNSISLDSFDSKISYYKFKSKTTESNSTIIDYYMRFIYSSLEYYILPVAKIAMDVYEANNSWDFGKNVLESVKDFLKKYNQKMYGSQNVDSFTDEEMKIIDTLREYGVNYNSSFLNREMIKQINEKLKIRYSTFDILKALHELSEEENENKTNFIRLRNKYYL